MSGNGSGPPPLWAQQQQQQAAPLNVRTRVPKLQGLPSGGNREESLSAAHSYAASKRLSLSHRSGGVSLRAPSNRSPRNGSQTERLGMSTLRSRDNILGTSMPSLTARDIVKQSGASMERAAELANWPSTNAMGSNSWLNKLEAMLNNKLSVIEAEKGTIYDSAMVYHENFGYFIELFKTYQPYLARIHGGYYEVVKSGLDMQHKIEQMQAEIYAAKKEAEEEMLRTVQDLKQTVVVLEKKLERAEMVKEKAVERMREKEDNFKQNQGEMDNLKMAYERSLEVCRAYCSGYKYLVKNVMKQAGEESSEMVPDLDALDSVTLIQKLERAQQDAVASKWQIEYLSSTSEIAYTKSILEEERRLFGVDQEKMQMELDMLRGSEGRLLHELQLLEDKHEKLEIEHKELRATMDSTFLAPWGDGKDIPPFLHTKFPVLYRPMEKPELKELLKATISECSGALQSGSYPDLLDELVRGISKRYSNHVVAEFGRNIMLALDYYKEEDPDCDLVSAVLSEDLGPHALIHRTRLVPELVKSLEAVFPSSKTISVSDFCEKLPELYPLKTREAHSAIRELLIERAGASGGIFVDKLSEGAPGETETALVDLLCVQLLEDLRVYSNSLRKEMFEAATRTRKRQKAGLKISFLELKEVLEAVEPNKKANDVAEFFYRAFNMPSVEEATAMLSPEDEDQWNAKTKLEEAGTTMDFLDRVLSRLSYANLLHPTPPAAAAAATGDAQATAGASGGATRTTSTGGASAKASEAGDARLDTPAKDGSQVAEDDDVQAAIKEAISDMVKQSELAPVARWAKIKDSADVPERKPVLNSIVALHRRELKQQPHPSMGAQSAPGGAGSGGEGEAAESGVGAPVDAQASVAASAVGSPNDKAAPSPAV